MCIKYIKIYTNMKIYRYIEIYVGKRLCENIKEYIKNIKYKNFCNV